MLAGLIRYLKASELQGRKVPLTPSADSRFQIPVPPARGVSPRSRFGIWNIWNLEFGIPEGGNPSGQTRPERFELPTYWFEASFGPFLPIFRQFV
jgi:hypothetical protein